MKERKKRCRAITLLLLVKIEMVKKVKSGSRVESRESGKKQIEKLKMHSSCARLSISMISRLNCKVPFFYVAEKFGS